ncbi:hypothetical protein [Terrihabitans sp. B22-R8]|uniref:hypothetical protein n=1 Tax=Terrihabitans sp. B22-R8 TaxID=3425128 RepID=UPI00403C662C
MAVRPSAILIAVSLAANGLSAAGAAAQDAVTPLDFCRELPPDSRKDCEAGAELLMRMPDESESKLSVRVMAAGGVFALDYTIDNPNGPHQRECASRGVIALPAGEPVRLLVTSGDEIYTLRVPARNIAVDLVPGRINEVRIDAPEAEDSIVGVLERHRGGSSSVRLRFVAGELVDRARLADLCRVSAEPVD